MAPLYYSWIGLGHSEQNLDYGEHIFGHQYSMMHESYPDSKNGNQILEYILDGAHIIQNKSWTKPEELWIRNTRVSDQENGPGDQKQTLQ